MTPAEVSTPSIEERQLALEERKLEIEREKVRAERFKGWTTGGSIVISLLIAGLTITFGVWSQHKQVMTQIELQDKQTKSQLDLQERNAKSQFEIKAAEVVMDTDTPAVTHNKAKALLALFPDRLPENFAQSFEPSEYAERRTATRQIHYKRQSPKFPIWLRDHYKLSRKPRPTPTRSPRQ